MCPWLVLGFYVPPYHRLPADRREYQPKSEGASATERGRAPIGRVAHTSLLCAVRFRSRFSPLPIAVRHGRRTAYVFMLSSLLLLYFLICIHLLFYLIILFLYNLILFVFFAILIIPTSIRWCTTSCGPNTIIFFYNVLIIFFIFHIFYIILQIVPAPMRWWAASSSPKTKRFCIYTFFIISLLMVIRI
jgi:hypothetical protein